MVFFGMGLLRMLLVLLVMVQVLTIMSLIVLRFDQMPTSKRGKDILGFHRQMIPAIKRFLYSPESQLRQLSKIESDWPDPELAPPLEYEKTRRRLRLVVEELWYFVGSRLRGLLQEAAGENHTRTAARITKILHEGIDYKMTALLELEKLSKFDGFNIWRSREASDLSDLVQRRLGYLQNPKDCRKARKLVCDLRKMCGFGCQLHHIVYCLITAYSTQRTMILFSQGWKYNEMGWEAVFRPLSETCNDAGIWNSSSWNGFNDKSQVVSLPIVEYFEGKVHPHLLYLPRAVPKDLARRIYKLHEVPAVWWVGQMIKYLMRHQPRTKDMITEASINMTFKRPIVGVHIRRSDKLYGEASFHSVDEYMGHVEEYYKQLSFSQQVETKRIYLASDDAQAFDEIHAKFPDYTIVGNRNVAEMAAEIRYSSKCLDGLIVDLHLLANSDFLVCTFSSQICRVAYEIMQSLHPDATTRFRSLDDSYYFGGGGMHRVLAVLSHQPTSEDQIDLRVGDLVKVFGNLWNGFSEGFNFRTGRSGLFPTYKVEDVIEAIDFPSAYPQVPQSGSHRLISEEIQYQIR